MINIEKTRKYCCDDISLIENWNKALNDTEEVWSIHHKLGEVLSKDELIERGLYYNRPPHELVFLNRLGHFLRHHPNSKYIYSDENGVIHRLERPSRQNRPHGKGHLYRKNGRGYWRVRWMVDGKINDVSTWCLDIEGAEKRASEIIATR